MKAQFLVRFVELEKIAEVLLDNKCRANWDVGMLSCREEAGKVVVEYGRYVERMQVKYMLKDDGVVI